MSRLYCKLLSNLYPFIPQVWRYFYYLITNKSKTQLKKGVTLYSLWILRACWKYCLKETLKKNIEREREREKERNFGTK